MGDESCWACNAEMDEDDLLCPMCGMESINASGADIARLSAEQAIEALRLHLSYTVEVGTEQTISAGLEGACLQVLQAAHALRPSPISAA